MGEDGDTIADDLAALEEEELVDEEPLTEDLRALGLKVRSIWDLGRTAWPYPEALPVLVDHLERAVVPDETLARIGDALWRKEAAEYWDRLAACYLSARTPGQEEGAAKALAGCTRKAQVEQLIELALSEPSRPSRVWFLRPIKRYGGERGRQVIERFLDDPSVAEEAIAALKGRGVNS